jgi:hypothetical protein
MFATSGCAASFCSSLRKAVPFSSTTAWAAAVPAELKNASQAREIAAVAAAELSTVGVGEADPDVFPEPPLHPATARRIRTGGTRRKRMRIP